MTTQKVVIDSSVILKWLSNDNEKYIDVADKILQDAQKGKIELFAPELAKYEVGNVLLYSKKLSPKQAHIIFNKFYNLPLSFIIESEKLANETYNIASKLEITYYDASFLSLAKQHEAILVTENIKHQGKTTGIKVISLADY